MASVWPLALCLFFWMTFRHMDDGGSRYARFDLCGVAGLRSCCRVGRDPIDDAGQDGKIRLMKIVAYGPSCTKATWLGWVRT
jgi:hypothetical protein